MSNFLEYLKKENVIENVIKLYSNNLKEESEIQTLNMIREYLYKNAPLNVESDLDFFGNIYQKNLNHREKKVLGEFYTPPSIVNYILNNIKYTNTHNIENKKLIDISCGSGSFIIQAIKRLIHYYLRILKYEKLSDLTPEESNIIILSIRENIYGVDINPIACILCQLNIHYVLFELFEIIKESDENYILLEFNIKNINSLALDHCEHYDFVVGNPPYLFIRDIPSEQRKLIEKRTLKTNKGQYDYYQIFLELSIKILKNGGKLGYIIPDSLLALSHRSFARKYIYNTTKIKEIYYTGPKFDDPVVSNIIIILQKENDEEKRENNIINIKLSNNQTKQLFQSSIKKWDFEFLIHLNDIDISIIEYLNENFPKLKGLNREKDFKLLLSRGAELAKTGEIIYCEKCQLYFPIPKKYLTCPECNSQLKQENIEKIIHSKVPEGEEQDFKKFLYSINRYQTKDNRYINISKKGINYKDLKIYDDRIIIRQLSENNLICASYGHNFSITSQSFYNLKIVKTPLPEFNHLYLLGIINSKLLSYYFIKCFGSYKRLFPRILIEKIKKLPIKIPNGSKERKIALEIKFYVDKILNLKNKHVATIEKLQNEIDSRVFNLYEISHKDQEYITEFISNLNN